jgi:hypothetical protein
MIQDGHLTVRHLRAHPCPPKVEVIKRKDEEFRVLPKRWIRLPQEVREQGTEVRIDAFSISIYYFLTFAGGLLSREISAGSTIIIRSIKTAPVLPEMSEAAIYAVMTRIMLRRLTS